MTTEDNFQLATSTALISRLNIFEPTKRPSYWSRKIGDGDGNSYGSATVTGRLGVCHNNLLDVAMFLARKSLNFRVFESRLEIIVDPYLLRVNMGGEGSEYSWSTIKRLKADIYEAELMLVANSGRIQMKTQTRIIEAYKVATLVLPARGIWAAHGKEKEDKREIEQWRFTKSFTRLVLEDIPRFYDPRPLCHIESGAVAAMARHLLSHDSRFQPAGGWKQEGLMAAARVERQQSKVRKEVAASGKVLEQMGIKVEEDRWHLTKN